MAEHSDSSDGPFAGFRFHRVLGPGSDAGVYEATEQASGRTVVIETLVGDSAADEDLREWFGWAWEAVRELDHSGVVDVHELGERDGVPFAVRESVEGADLGSVLESDGNLVPETADAIFSRLADALSALHEAGVVHGALGPESVLVADREEEVPYLTGFGRIEGHRRDDVRDLARIHAAMLGEEEAGTSPLADVLERAAAGRYRTAAALAEAVRSARAGHHPADDEGADEPAGEAASTRPVRRARRGLALVALVAAGAAAAIWTTSGGDSEPATEPAAEAQASLPEDAPPPAPGVSVTGEGVPPIGAGGAAPIAVPGEPAGVSVRDGVVYTVTAESGELIGYDEGSGEEVVGPVDLGAPARELTIADRVAWVTLPREDALARVDLKAAEPTAERVDVGERPSGLTGVGGAIWVADERSGGLTRVETSDTSAEDVPIGIQEPEGISYGLGSLWVTDEAGALVEVDPEGRASSEPVETGAEPRGVLVAERAVWVANSGDGTVTRLDPESGETETIEVGGEPLEVSADPERIWVSNAAGYVSSIAIESGKVEQIEVPADLGKPLGVAVGDEVWVTTGKGDSLLPIGARR